MVYLCLLAPLLLSVCITATVTSEQGATTTSAHGAPPIGQPTLSPSGDTTLVLGETATLTCDRSTLEDLGQPPAGQVTWMKGRDELPDTGQVLELLGVFDNQMSYSCSYSNSYGSSNSSNGTYITVVVNATMEYPEKPTTLKPFYNDESFTFNCTYLGDYRNIRPVTWAKLNDPDFNTYAEFRVDIGAAVGDFSYGYPVGLTSELSWRVAKREWTCDNVEFYSGNYTCRVETLAGGELTTATSPPITIDVQYWLPRDDASRMVFARQGEEGFRMGVDHCTNANNLMYAWTYADGRPLRAGIDATTNPPLIDHVTAADYTDYKLQVSALVEGKVYMVGPPVLVSLREEGRPLEVSNIQVLKNVTSSSVTFTWTDVTNSSWYPPLSYSVSVYNSDDPETNTTLTSLPYTVTGLDEGTSYNFSVQTLNNRPVTDGPNFSHHTHVATPIRTVHSRPNITVRSFYATSVYWDYHVESSRSSLNVTVRIKHRDLSDPKKFIEWPGSWSIYSGRATLQGVDQNYYHDYEVTLTVFEGDLPYPSAEHVHLEKSGLINVGLIVGLVFGVGGFLLLMAILIIGVRNRVKWKRSQVDTIILN